MMAVVGENLTSEMIIKANIEVGRSEHDPPTPTFKTKRGGKRSSVSRSGGVTAAPGSPAPRPARAGKMTTPPVNSNRPQRGVDSSPPLPY